MTDKQKNADRFTGFADIYESSRPSMPKYTTDVLCKYLGKRPALVLDIGCGTGLSSEIWQNVSDSTIGVEPSGDMLMIAEKKANEKLRFIKAFSDRIDLPDECADIIVCSQSFHWMEPIGTLNEVNRLLKHNGIFAAIDYDWPPVAKWEVEKAYADLQAKVRILEAENQAIKNTFTRYPKSEHLKNINASGHFIYARELLFCNKEHCTKERLLKMIFSQGGLQTVLHKTPELIKTEVENFTRTVEEIYGNAAFDIELCYRMRIGIKK